jgi:hypothetical protein
MQEGNAQKTTFGITLQGVSSDQNEMEAIKPYWNKFDILMYYIRIEPNHAIYCIVGYIPSGIIQIPNGCDER